MSYQSRWVTSIVIGLGTLLLLPVTAWSDTILFRSGGSLNGQAVDSAGSIIVVEPGETISGTLEISVHNSHSAGPIVPVGATVTWGDRSGQVRQVRSHVGQGWTNLSVSFLDTAPDTRGLYYIILGNAGECDYLQVMSGTNWALPGSPSYCGALESGPIWFDGNDLGWDWTSEQFKQALDTGQVTQMWWLGRDSEFIELTSGGNWVGISVQQVGDIFYDGFED